MVIAVDIDDVLYPFADGAIKYVTEQTGKVVTCNELFGDQEFTLSGLHRDEFVGAVKKYQNSSHALEYGPVDGATRAIADLAINHDVYLVTSRHPNLKDVTSSWLGMHIESSHLKEVIFVGNHWSGEVIETKADVCSRIQADYMIEDQPRYIDILKGHSTVPILFGEYPWNTDYSEPHSKRAKNWVEVLEIIKA